MIFFRFVALTCLLPATIAAQDSDTDPSVKDVSRLTNLPHVYINTFNGRSITSKENYVYARMWYVDEDDNVQFFDSLEIRGRGNSTWNMAKKPYKLKFQKKAKLLGKGYANTKKWTMLANHGDKTLIRNAVTSLMGERAGLKFNPAAKFVDFTLNDQYVGNYQISDQVDVRPHRVNIFEQDYPLTDESDITGGYLLEADGFGDFHYSSYWDDETQSYLPPDGFGTAHTVPIRIHYPDADELDQRQTDYIRSFVQQFEQRLFADDFADPESGYRQNVDSMSLANWYLCTEMSGNVDGFFSLYFYKEQQDDHLFWGPLWDYDIAYNNDNRTRSGTANTERQLMCNDGYGNARVWIQRMWEDPWFAKLINRRYTEILDGGIEDYLNAKIDSLAELLDASQQLNYQRWGINVRTLRERVLYSTYNQYIADLRTYLNRHLPYLQTTFASMLPEEPDTPEDPDDPDDPKDPDDSITPDFPADATLYYAISNAGAGTFIDVLADDDAICANARDEESESQQWQIIPLANGYRYIVNRATGYALSDPTEGEPTATTLTGTQLTLAEGDSLDIRQQWNIVAQTGDRYNFINRFSHHGANLSGGRHDNGTPVLSYTSDGRDGGSNNRMWYIQAVGEVEEPDDPTVGIDDLASLDYALAYDPLSGRLHFGSDNLSDLRFPVRVYDRSGRLLQTFRACDGTSLSALPRGLYLVTWEFEGRRHTVKLTR
ncbi:MAG: CotH kinase family protein [Bacteroidaceae bacterium]|nr:CotH kinase family protein [Bacteroidaceae bacterium]